MSQSQATYQPMAPRKEDTEHIRHMTIRAQQK